MALTRDFKQTISERARRDPRFATALLDEAATLFLNGEPTHARLILRDLGQCHHRVRDPGVEDRDAAEEPSPNALGARQSQHGQSGRHLQGAAQEAEGGPDGADSSRGLAVPGQSYSPPN